MSALVWMCLRWRPARCLLVISDEGTRLEEEGVVQWMCPDLVV